MSGTKLSDDEKEGNISNAGSEEEHSQELVRRTSGQEKTTNSLAIPQDGTYGVSGGDFKNATFGSPQYTLTKQDGVIDGDFRKQIFHNTYNTYITEQASYVPEESQKDTQTPFAEFGEGWIHLSDKIGLFKNRALCKRAHVYEGLHLSKITGNIPIAIKFLTPYDEANIKEARILSKLQHHNVVSIIHSDVYNEGPFPTMYIAMELCLTKTLNDYILEQKTSGNPVEFTERLSLIRQLTEGLNFIHHNNVLHRDLKPENILFGLDGRSLKISDFGLSKELSHGRSVTAQSMIRPGTDGYRAPETYNSDIISKHADIFSYGLVVYFILSDGSHAFGDEPDLWNYNIKKNKNRNIQLLAIPRSESAQELVEWTLQFEPSNRPSCEKILELEFFWHDAARSPKASLPCEDQFSTNPENQCTEIRKASAKFPSHPSEGKANAILVFDRDSQQVAAFSPSAMSWIPMQTQRIPKDIVDNNFTSLRLTTSIYVLMETKAVYRFEYCEFGAEWKRVADMLENHGWFAPSVALDGCIYVVGRGYSPYPTSSRKLVEKYDPTSDKWTRVRDMNRRRENHYIAGCNGYIYCFAGRDEHWNATKNVERYHAASDSWQDVSPMPRPMDFPPMRAVSFNDIIYVMNHSDIQLYDTTNDSWTIAIPGGPFPYKRATAFKAYLIDNCIIGVGSKNGKTQMHRLDLTKLKWTMLLEVEKNIVSRECVEICLDRGQPEDGGHQVFHHYQ